MKCEKGPRSGAGSGWRSRLYVALTVAASSMLFAAFADAADAPKLKAPPKVSPGKKLTLKAKGFPADEKVSFTAAIKGPAAFSGKGLGSLAANAAGKARRRARFPLKYRWCNADLDCTKYAWPKGAKIKLTAQSKQSGTTAEKVVKLKCRGKCAGQ